MVRFTHPLMAYETRHIFAMESFGDRSTAGSPVSPRFLKQICFYEKKYERAVTKYFEDSVI